MPIANLEALLGVQDLDITLDQLRHRREVLAERAELTEVATRRSQVAAQLAEVSESRDGVLRDEKRLDDDAAGVSAKIRDVDKQLYSGSITSPRELQALQADLESLKRHRSELEDRELEVMERREDLDGQVDAVQSELDALTARGDALVARIRSAESEIDTGIEVASAERANRASEIPTALMSDYELRRARNRGVDTARLIGPMCQGCRLSIPATELDVIRREPDATIYTCDNCGSILVPSSLPEG